MKRLLFGILILMCSFSVLAQKATVYGEVFDENGDPLIGATVRTADYGTTTDENGKYRLSLNAGTYTVLYSYIGYSETTKTLTLTENQQLEVNVALSEGVEILKTATVTSGRYEKPLGEVTVSLEVIKPTLIENSNTIQVDEVLTKVPSLTIVDGQANIRNGSGYSYGAGSRVLLLVDDLPALQGDAGFPNWDFVPVENISQVEVLKGAASALYGSSAMNGIINIRTAYPTAEPYTKISTFVTGYGSPKNEAMKWWSDTTVTPGIVGFSFAHRQKFGKLGLVLGAYGVGDQSFRKEEYKNYGRFNVNTSYLVTDELLVGVNVNVQRGNNANFFLWQNDTTGALLPMDNTVTTNKNSKLIIDPYVTYTKGNSKHKLAGRFFDINNKQANDLADQSIKSRQLYGSYQFQQNFEASDLILTAGIVGSRTVINAALYGDSTYRTSNSAVFLQLDKKLIDKLNLSLGVRYERNTIASPNNAAKEQKPVMRAGANYQLGQATYLRGSFGQGYRFPTVAEKYISTSLGAINIFPNDTLTSETGWSTEIGVKQGFKIGNFKGYFDAVYYWMEYNNMMEFIFDNYGNSLNTFGFASLNIGNTRVRGVDLSAAGFGKIGKIETALLTGYTYSSPKYKDFEAVDLAKNSSTENVLKYRFNHTFKADLYLTYEKISLGWSTQTYSFMENIDWVFTQDFAVNGAGRFRDNHNGLTVVSDLRLAYEIIKDLKVSFLVKNIMKEEYALRPGLLNAPRSFSVRVDYKL